MAHRLQAPYHSDVHSLSDMQSQPNCTVKNGPVRAVYGALCMVCKSFNQHGIDSMHGITGNQAGGHMAMIPSPKQRVIQYASTTGVNGNRVTVGRYGFNVNWVDGAKGWWMHRAVPRGTAPNKATTACRAANHVHTHWGHKQVNKELQTLQADNQPKHTSPANPTAAPPSTPEGLHCRT